MIRDASGSLATEGAERILLQLRSTAASGSLQFRGYSGVLATLVFEAGSIRKASSTLSAFLGGVLYELGLVDGGMLNASLAQVAAERVCHGAVLRGLGAVRHDQLQHALREQIERRIAGVVGLPAETRWTFQADVDRLARYGGGDWPLVDLRHAVWRGLRDGLRPDLVARASAAVGTHLLVLQPEADLDAFRFDPAERALAASFRTARPAPVRAPGLTSATSLALVYLLRTAGLLEWAARGTPSAALSSVFPNAGGKTVAPASSSSPDSTRSNCEVVSLEHTRERAETFLREGKVREATELLADAWKLWPSDPDIQVLDAWARAAVAGRAHLSQHASHFDRLVAEYPDNARAAYYRFRLRRSLGRGALALRDLRRAVALEPRFLDAARDLRLFEARHARGESIEVALSIPPPSLE